MADPKPQPRSPAASALIAGCLGLQLLAASRLLCAPRSFADPPLPRAACAPRLWPFLDYPMFSEAHRVGETVARDGAVIVLQEGGELRLLPGPDPRGLAAGELVDALRSGRSAEGLRLASASERVGGREIVELRLERETLVLGREGFRSAGTETLRRWSIAAPSRSAPEQP